jgi:hypothetical protein
LYRALVHAQSTRSVALTHASRHQQKRLSSYDDALLGLRGAYRRLHGFTLLGREGQRLRSRTGVAPRHPRLGIDHAPPLQDVASFGQISAERY